MLSPENIKAFVFAAGLGTRLKPLTDDKPKALVTVNDKTLIDIVIDNLSSQGINQFVVNIHHFADMIVKSLSARKNVAFSDERALLCDTGGAIKHARELLGNDTFLVHNVDIISNFSLGFMLEHHKEDRLATLLVSARKTSRYLLFDQEMRLVGWMNETTGEIKTPFENLDVDKCIKLAFSGIHLINPKIHTIMNGWPDKFSIIDFYLDNAARHDIFGLVQPGFQMVDVGKLESLSKASEFLKEQNQ